MKISDRLQTIASFIKDNASVADVGADHGLLEIQMLKEGRIKSVLAIENKSGPFQILRNNLLDYNVKLSLSDGISKIDDSVDTVAIAGMGGVLIVDILSKDKDKLKNIKQIVVDAHRDNEIVRRSICELGYYIEKEKIVYEKEKYYFVISFLKGHKDYSQSEYEFGTNIAKDPLFEQYRKYEMSKMSENLVKYKSSKKSSKDGIRIREEKIERLKRL